MKTLTKPTKDELIEAYKSLGKEGHILTINEEALTASLDRISKRSSLGTKRVFNYRFRSAEMLLDYVTSYYNNKVESIKKQEERKAEVKIKKAEEMAAIKEGDIFCYSWGYEQTNVDFYQVISKKGKSSLVIRPISYETVEECSWGSDYVKPCANAFTGKEETVRLSGGYFKRSYGYARLTDENSKHYRSWYA